MPDIKFVKGAALCEKCGTQVKEVDLATIDPFFRPPKENKYNCINCGYVKDIKWTDTIQKVTNDGYKYGMFSKCSLV